MPKHKKASKPKPVRKNKLLTEPPVPTEYETIVELCFIKDNLYVIRFLNGDTYTLNTADMPKPILVHKPKWDTAQISKARNSIILEANKAQVEIQAYIIHSRGKPIK